MHLVMSLLMLMQLLQSSRPLTKPMAFAYTMVMCLLTGKLSRGVDTILFAASGCATIWRYRVSAARNEYNTFVSEWQMDYRIQDRAEEIIWFKE